MSLSHEVANTRTITYSNLEMQLSRPQAGRYIINDPPAGVGKTRSALAIMIDQIRRRQTTAAKLFLSYSEKQLRDSINSVDWEGVVVVDPLPSPGALYMHPDWDAENDDEPMSLPGEIVVFHYRGKGQEGMCRQLDKTTPCMGCPFYRFCPYTWQRKALHDLDVALLLGSHALIRGKAADEVMRLLENVSHVVVDEDCQLFVQELSITLPQMTRIIHMCHWQLGAAGLGDFRQAMAKLCGKHEVELSTAKKTARAFFDACLSYRREGKLAPEWPLLNDLLRDIIIAPTAFESQEEHSAYVAELRAARFRIDKHEEELMLPRSASWRNTRYVLFDLHKVVNKFLFDKDRRLTFEVTSAPGFDPMDMQRKLVAKWVDQRVAYHDGKGTQADLIFLDATPDGLLARVNAGLIPKDKFEWYQAPRLSHENFCLTIYEADSAANTNLLVIGQRLEYLIAKARTVRPGDILIVLPTISLYEKYQKKFADDPAIHVAYIQIISGLNSYRHCDSVIIVGNFIPGANGLADFMTMTHGLPMKLGYEKVELFKVPAGRVGKDNRRTIQPGAFRGISTVEAFYAEILSKVLQAIYRARPLDKPEGMPVQVYAVTNLPLAEYIAYTGRRLASPVIYGNLAQEMGLRKRSLSTRGLILQGLFNLRGGLLLDYGWLRQRRQGKRKLFADDKAIDHFLHWLRHDAEAARMLTEFGAYHAQKQGGKFVAIYAEGWFRSKASETELFDEIIGVHERNEQAEREANGFNMTARHAFILTQLNNGEKLVSQLTKDAKKRSFFDKEHAREQVEECLFELQKAGEIWTNQQKWFRSA